MRNDKILYDPIRTKQIGKHQWIAITKYWIEGETLNGKPFKIEVEQYGTTEQNAKDKLIKYLTQRQTANRQPGYYRVKQNGAWKIVSYLDTWYIGGEKMIFTDFDEIDETPINPEPEQQGRKEFIRGAACAVATLIRSHGAIVEANEVFEACVGSWDNFMSAEPDQYDIDILEPHFKPKGNE